MLKYCIIIIILGKGQRAGEKEGKNEDRKLSTFSLPITFDAVIQLYYVVERNIYKHSHLVWEMNLCTVSRLKLPNVHEWVPFRRTFYGFGLPLRVCLRNLSHLVLLWFSIIPFTCYQVTCTCRDREGDFWFPCPPLSDSQYPKEITALCSCQITGRTIFSVIFGGNSKSYRQSELK